MIRAALALALSLSGCTVIEHVQVLPTVGQGFNVGCCVAYWELSRSTSGSVEVQKSPTTWSVSAKVHHKF
jgi:hypothetical protein